MSFTSKPGFVKQAFANNGIKDTIPDTTLNQGYASYDEGFPAITMQPKESGGLPPRGQDMNGILNAITQFNLYSQMGGTYGLDNNILTNGGYAKNSIVFQDDGIYRSLIDNNTDDFVNDPSVIGSTWQLILDYSVEAGTNGVPGQLSFFARTDVPTGWLRCDGTQYTKASFPDFWDEYLTQNKIPTCSYADYATEISDNGNCGKFAVDLVNLTFKVPTIQGQVFISQALSSGDIGKFNAESLPNITGQFDGNNNASLKSGCFSQTGTTAPDGDGNMNGTYITFDASRSSSVYQNSAIVQPNNIQYPIFVCVANVQVPVSEAQYNGFIGNLNQKVDLDGSNATFSNLSATAKDNITSLVGWEKISEFEIDNDSEIEFTGLNDGYQHKFEFINLKTSTNCFMCAILGNLNSYITTGSYIFSTFGKWSQSTSQWLNDSITSENGTYFAVTSNHSNYWYLSNQNAYVNFTILSNFLDSGNQFFEFNSIINSPQQSGTIMITSGNGELLNVANISRIKFYLSSGNFASGIVKHYIIK